MKQIAIIIAALAALTTPSAHAEDNLVMQECREQLARALRTPIPADRIAAHCKCRWEEMFKQTTSTGEPVTGEMIAGALRGRARDVAEMEEVKKKAFEACKGELGW